MTQEFILISGATLKTTIRGMITKPSKYDWEDVAKVVREIDNAQSESLESIYKNIGGSLIKAKEEQNEK